MVQLVISGPWAALANTGAGAASKGCCYLTWITDESHKASAESCQENNQSIICRAVGTHISPFTNIDRCGYRCYQLGKHAPMNHPNATFQLNSYMTDLMPRT
ncbi:hypothetical protein E2542_SST30015 [Spatholobus suberectus]|nr:hypothetical protein E2542_SST30015 [Spatholobus suberectus]